VRRAGSPIERASEEKVSADGRLTMKRKKATPDRRLYGFRLARLLMILFHPTVLLHRLLFHLLQLGLLFGSEHTIDLAME
jgi:hypothetical protein